MNRTKFFAILVIGTFVEIILLVPLIMSMSDPTAPIIAACGLWLALFMTAAMRSTLKAGEYRSKYSSGNQLPDYMATNQYFNNQAMRRDLDQMSQHALNAELQAKFDRMNKP